MAQASGSRSLAGSGAGKSTPRADGRLRRRRRGGLVDRRGPPAELTGEDILDKLLDVDGDGSSLDCDTLDGVDSPDLARVTKRVVDFPRPAFEIMGFEGPVLANIAGATMTVRFRVPPDAAPDMPFDFLLVGDTGSGTPCGIVLDPSASVLVPGTSYAPLTATIDGGETVTISSSDYVELKFTFSSDTAGVLAPGTWVAISIGREGANVSDTCPGGLNLWYAAVEYQEI
jgi:hypothetical protein